MTREDFYIKSTLLMLTVGEKTPNRNKTKHNLHRTLFTLERSVEATQDPYIQSHSGVMEFFQAWNSISFTFANQRLAMTQEN